MRKIDFFIITLILRNVLLMLNAIYFICIVLICINLFGNNNGKKSVYNNSLRRLLALPKHNSASEMFVNS